MSVINKMLRDLDSRQTTDAAQARTQTARTGLARGTLIVNEGGVGQAAKWWLRTGALPAALLLGLLAERA